MLRKYMEKEKAAYIILNNDRTNALSLPILSEIYGEVCRLEHKRDCHIVVLTSKYRGVFSSGLHLKSLYKHEDAEQTSLNIYKAVQLVKQINQTIIHSKKIYIAALSGATIGSAVSIALACDLRLGSVGTWFWLPDPQYGGILEDGGLDLLVQKIGRSSAASLALTNERINADKLFQWGILNRFLNDNNFAQELEETISSMAANSFDTLSMTKRILNRELVIDTERTELEDILRKKEMFERIHAIFGNRGD